MAAKKNVADSRSVEERGESDNLYYRALVWAENVALGYKSSKGKHPYTVSQQLHIWATLFILCSEITIAGWLAFAHPDISAGLVTVAFCIPWALAIWYELGKLW